MQLKSINLTITYFKQGKEKIVSVSKILDYTTILGEEDKNLKYTYKTVQGRKILGYYCKGIEITIEEFTVVCYHTAEAKVSFAEMFQSQSHQKNARCVQVLFFIRRKTISVIAINEKFEECRMS